jgi:hypothetical protein
MCSLLQKGNMDVNHNSTGTSCPIKELRERFLNEIDAHPDLYDAVDREKVIHSDLWVSRFLNFLDQGPDRAFDHMIETFRWRKSFGINHFNPLEIPREVYMMAPLFEYYPDPAGRKMFYVRVKMHRKIAILEERIKKSFMNYVNDIDTNANREHGMNLVFDMTGSGYSNADLDLLFFLLPTIRKHYPNAVQFVYVLGLPWILNSIAKFALALIPSDTAKKVRFLTQDEFHNIMPIDTIPDFLGGTATRNYRRIPRGAKTCVELGAEIYGLSEEEVIKLLKPSLKHITEGKDLAVEDDEE